ncbi:helix-turn-helix domain-containing protein [Streptomyces sp. NPDC051315]|uniref:helix-turn-helix domain-containing protein n=1 Tax=Streptomyces sp. NPDC051315 TaxID=3365650 RepID=UPI0037B55DBE
MPMAHSHGKYADFESLRKQAIALRRAGHSLRQIRDELQVHNKETLQRLVEGEPPPEWAKRPRAKDELRERARELRQQGWTYKQIQAELGCSKSSVSLWVRDLPAPGRPRSDTGTARRDVQRAVESRDATRATMQTTAGIEVGPVSPPQDQPNQCRRGLLRLPPGRHPPKRRPTPSHRRLVVRHSRGCPSG